MTRAQDDRSLFRSSPDRGCVAACATIRQPQMAVALVGARLQTPEQSSEGRPATRRDQPSSLWSVETAPIPAPSPHGGDDVSMEREPYQHQFEGGPRARPKRMCMAAGSQ